MLNPDVRQKNQFGLDKQELESAAIVFAVYSWRKRMKIRNGVMKAAIKYSNLKCNTLHKSIHYLFYHLRVLFKGSGASLTLNWEKRAANVGKKKGLPGKWEALC